MSRRKLKRDERRFLKRAGFGREFAGLGGLAVALDEAQHGARPLGYEVQPSVSFGRLTRRRLRRERWKRFWRGLFFWRAAGPSSRDRRTRSRFAEAPALRSYAPAVLTLVYGGSLAVVLLLVAGLWELVQGLGFSD